MSQSQPFWKPRTVTHWPMKDNKACSCFSMATIISMPDVRTQFEWLFGMYYWVLFITLWHLPVHWWNQTVHLQNTREMCKSTAERIIRQEILARVCADMVTIGRRILNYTSISLSCWWYSVIVVHVLIWVDWGLLLKEIWWFFTL